MAITLHAGRAEEDDRTVGYLQRTDRSIATRSVEQVASKCGFLFGDRLVLPTGSANAKLDMTHQPNYETELNEGETVPQQVLNAGS